jgi:iron complex transport system permease protein
MVLCTLIATAVFALAITGLSLGTLAIPLGRIITTLRGDGDQATSLVVLNWRLPRIVMAAVIGGALGMAGATFQSLVRNPLGSPDVIGFTTGAHTGALIVLIGFAADPVFVMLGALGGGLITAIAVYAMAWRGGIEGYRLILIGIAISAMLNAVNIWLMVSASLDAAMGAAMWGAGSLAGITWTRAIPPMLFCLVVMAIALSQGRTLALLEMGDDLAGALGLDVHRTRLGLMILGVSLTAAATAPTGPVTFIALAAPQLAQRLMRSGSVTLAASAWTGALLLLSADLIGQHAFPGISLPVGVVSVSVGGLYLLWLLVGQRKIRIS